MLSIVQGWSTTLTKLLPSVGVFHSQLPCFWASRLYPCSARARRPRILARHGAGRKLRPKKRGWLFIGDVGRDKIQYFTIPSQNLTWNLKMAPWNRRFLWKPSFLSSMLNFGRVFHRNSAHIWTNPIWEFTKIQGQKVEPWTTFFSGSAAR